MLRKKFANVRTVIEAGRRLRALGILLLACPLNGYAFNLDTDTPIRIQADSARLDDQAGTATYSGRVLVSQGESVLEAEKVVLFRDKDGLGRMEAYGIPAHFRQSADPKTNTSMTDAWALEIRYSRSENRITFHQKARIEQNGNQFRGETIHYDTQRRIVTAQGNGKASADGSGRVEMIIQPRRPASKE